MIETCLEGHRREILRTGYAGESVLTQQSRWAAWAGPPESQTQALKSRSSLKAVNSHWDWGKLTWKPHWQAAWSDYPVQNLFWVVATFETTQQIFLFAYSSKNAHNSGPGNAKRFRLAVLEHALHFTLCNHQEFWKWQNLGINTAFSSSTLTSGTMFWILIWENSITRVSVKFSCQNSYLFQSCIKNFIRHNFQCCWMLKFSTFIRHNFQHKFAISFGCFVTAKKLQGQRPSDLFSHFLSSLLHWEIELLCLYKQEN